MHYVKTKRNKVDICNICKNVTSLSWDHVPPKGSIELAPMEMETIFQVFTGKRKDRKLRESQNGVKFRTICKNCNEKIGQRYDPIIKEFAISVGQYLKSVLKFPPVIHHKTKPVALVRGILGHLLAAKVDYDQVVFDEKVRAFLLDETLAIPDGINVHYWLYPYTQIIIMRDFVMPARRGNFSEVGCFHTLKYFPVAYLVSDRKQYEGLLNLTQYRHMNTYDEAEIPIHLDRTEHPYWPEIVDKGNIIFGGQSILSSVSAAPRKSFQNNLS